MDTNKKTFNFTLLFIIAYAVLAVLVIIYIWWPKGNDSIVSNSKFTYEDIDEKEKAIDIYKTKIISLLAEKDLNQLYQKLNEEYKSEKNITEKNYQAFLEESGFISNNGISVGECTVNIQKADVYVYRFNYTCNNVSKYVNVIETKPYEYTLSFEQNSIPIVNNTYTETNEGTISSSTKTTIIDNIKYEVTKTILRENGITYTLKITNNSDKNVEYNFDNITNVTAIMSDGKRANMGGTVISADEDILTPGSSLEKELFFAISSQDQNKIKTIRLQQVKIGDEIKTVSINT
ncbi:MAG: hypothetical protein ACLTON_03425 [Christensenellales bacterium]|jgi:hypothetical protein